jgi:hypothetical protein
MINKLIGMDFIAFKDCMICKDGQKTSDIEAKEARLIPVYKDEGALASVFLSGIKLIKEFQKHFLSEAEIKSGKIYVYREVDFKKQLKSTNEGCRVDGLLILVKSEKIVDAVVFEMKSKMNLLDQKQIEKYIELCGEIGVNKLVTISNQPTSNPHQSPVLVKINRSSKFSLIHFSWEYVMTVASNFINSDKAIEDSDQKEIMREIYNYLQCDETGSYVFSEVKKEWKDFVSKIDNGATITDSDECLAVTAVNLAQMESHLALELSKLSFSYVTIVEPKNHRENYKEKIEDIITGLKKEKAYASHFRVKNSIADMEMIVYFASKKLEFGINIEIPEDKEKNKSKLSWLKTYQIDHCKKKNLDDFVKISNELFIDIYIKNTSKCERYPFSDFDMILSKVGEKDIREFKLVYVRNNLGKNFEGSKIVSEIENASRIFYKVFVENLKPIKNEVAKLQPELIKPDVASPGANDIQKVDEKVDQKVFTLEDPEKIAS